MSKLDTYFEREPVRFQHETQVVKGEVIQTAKDFDDDVWVRVPDDYGDHSKIGPCGWTPRWTPKGVYFPHKGDQCVVALTDEGDPEIIRYKKQKGATPDHSGLTDDAAEEIDNLENGMDDLTGGTMVQAGHFAQTGGTYDG